MRVCACPYSALQLVNLEELSQGGDTGSSHPANERIVLDTLLTLLENKLIAVGDSDAVDEERLIDVDCTAAETAARLYRLGQRRVLRAALAEAARLRSVLPVCSLPAPVPSRADKTPAWSCGVLSSFPCDDGVCTEGVCVTRDVTAGEVIMSWSIHETVTVSSVLADVPEFGKVMKKVRAL